MPTKRVRNTGISWQGRYRDASGKEHSKTFRTKREAKAWEDDQIRAVRRGEWLDPQTSTITVHDLIPGRHGTTYWQTLVTSPPSQSRRCGRQWSAPGCTF